MIDEPVDTIDHVFYNILNRFDPKFNNSIKGKIIEADPENIDILIYKLEQLSSLGLHLDLLGINIYLDDSSRSMEISEQEELKSLIQSPIFVDSPQIHLIGKKSTIERSPFLGISK
jgi:hypothetical protein